MPRALQGLFTLCVASILAVGAAATEGAVVALTDDDFDSGRVASMEFALVEYFAPWCGHCKKLEPEFHAAAEQLKAYQPHVVFAAVDATTQKIESSRQGVRGFPTLKWYVRGVATDYTGERNSRSIVKWIKKKTGLPAEHLNTQSELESFVRKHSIGVVAYLKKTPGRGGGGDDVGSGDAKGFMATARYLDEVAFAFTHNPQLRGAIVDGAAAQPEVEGGTGETESDSSAMVVFKKPIAGFKHNSTVFTGSFQDAVRDWLMDPVMEFVQVEMLPRVVQFTEAGMSDIFNGFIKTQIIFFGHFDKAKDGLFDALAVKYRGDFVVVTVPPNEFRAMDFFDVDVSNLPTMRLLDLHTEPMYKYRYEGPIEEAAVVGFVEKFQNGDLVPILKSEPVPDSTNAKGQVVTVVGQTFGKTVVESQKWVLLQVYATWCGHCKLLEPIWQELAASRADDDRLVIAQIDGTANEHMQLDFAGFPAIQLWAPGAEQNVATYKGARTLKDLSAFLDQNIGRLSAQEQAAQAVATGDAAATGAAMHHSTAEHLEL